jgi:protein-disulfide isomerase
MPKKFSFDFVFGTSTVIFIAVALLAGYAIGSFYPFDGGNTRSQAATDGLTMEELTSLGQQQQPAEAAGYDVEDIRSWATEIGLDMNQFNSCFESQEYLGEIRQDYQDGLALQVTGTPAFFVGNERDGLVVLSGAQPYDAFKNVIDSYLNGTAPPAEVTLSGDPFRNNTAFIGDKDAQVVIVEFSDFQCPFCRAFYTETLPQIEREYLETGKAVLIYKEYPLTSIHPGAVHYGLAAKCAQEQGMWRQMHDKIFDEQNKLGIGTIPYQS